MSPVHSKARPEAAAAGRITFEEFLALPEAEGVRREWVNGEIIEMTPASLKHQDIGGFLYLAISLFLMRRPLGKVYSPVLMKLGISGREPDLVFIREGNLQRRRDNYIDGPADLALEIISPESRRRDEAKKPREYAEAGVEEFWLIDPKSRRVELFYLAAPGRYESIPPDPDGFFASRVIPGFRFSPDWLWMDRPPAQVVMEAAWDFEAKES